MNRCYAADPERVEGALLGAAVGDALGWPQENRSSIVGGRAARQIQPAMQFRAWERNAGGQFRPYRTRIDAGTYSDDTQLLLAVARACLRGDGWMGWLRDIELPFWPAYESGGGGAVLRAARAWAEGKPPWATANDKASVQRAKAYFEAGANGAAMRIAPHAVVTASHSSAEPLLERCLLDSLLTHGHPRALVGALAYAVGLRAALTGSSTVGYGHFVEAALDEPLWGDPDWFAHAAPSEWRDAAKRITGEDPRNGWANAAREMQELLGVALGALESGTMANDERTLDGMGCFGKQGGSGTITAAAALYMAARTAARPPSGLLRTAFLPSADTDTLASMTGAVLGAVHGTLWLGGLDRAVQDAAYISQIAHDLAAAHPASGGGRQPVTASAVRKFMDSLDGAGPVKLPDGRDAAITDVRELHGSGRTRVRQTLVTARDGQTLAFDVVSKQPTPQPPLSSERGLTPDSRTAGNGPAGDAGASLPDQDPDQLRLPLPGGPPHQRAVGLVEAQLSAVDIERSAHFYLRVLGLPGHRNGDTVRIAGGLVLRQAVAATAATDSVYVIASQDVAAAAARLSKSKYRNLLVEAEHQDLLVRDPDGHRLRIVPAPDDAAAHRSSVPDGSR